MPDLPSQRQRHARALSSKQERKLVDFLDEKFLHLTRGFKKRFVRIRPHDYPRSEPTTHLPTLSHYLDATRQILSMILQIPPIDPSTSLRTAFLLRLTSDVLNSIPGYPAGPKVLPEVLDWLDDLDQAWLVVLQSQVWDPQEGAGTDLLIDAEEAADGKKSSPLTQTESTRLRSLLVGGVVILEEWLESCNTAQDDSDSVEGMLQRLGLQAGFDELFSRTLDFLGGLGGIILEPLP